jgi:hypothetical protein
MKYFFACLALSVSVIQAHFMTVQLRTGHIYHRYYMIKRLEKSCELLRNDLSLRQSMPLHLLQPDQFNSKDIYSAVKAMKELKNIDPFFELWDDFCAYKSVYDYKFMREFVELILALYDLVKPMPVKRPSASLEGLLLFIDNAVSGNHMVRSLDEPDEVTTDGIAKRFYVIKRLQKTVQFLEHLQANNIEILYDKGISNRSLELMLEIENFHHDRVRESVIQMFQTKKLEPLLQLYDEVKQYRFAQDESFLQEMLMNIFLVYKAILFRHGSQHVDPVVVDEMNHVLEIYEQLSSMPLDQTLEAIDEVTDRLIAFQAENTAHSSYVRWGLPALFMCACVGIYYVLHQG